MIDAIQQHHGTTVMAFFYQKALETDSHSSVNKDDFRYPGPRPSSKEAALLMLADTRRTGGPLAQGADAVRAYGTWW